MPSISTKQQSFFQKVRNAKNNPNAPAHLKKVANSMTDKDIDDFANNLAELRVKKAVLSVLKDVREPMYLNEEGGEEGNINPVAKIFKVNDDFASYIKKYVGQPLSSKELEALETFKRSGGREATKIERTEIWFESTSFNNSVTTVIKKMKDGSQFSFNAFTKYTPVEDKEKEQPEEPGMEIPPLPPTGGPSEMGQGPEGAAPPGAPMAPAENPEQKPEEKKKDEIVITKSILFKDDIKGGSILAELLKKLDIS